MRCLCHSLSERKCESIFTLHCKICEYRSDQVKPNVRHKINDRSHCRLRYKKSNDKDLAVPELNNEIKVLKFLEEKKFNLCASLIAYERGLFIKIERLRGQMICDLLRKQSNINSEAQECDSPKQSQRR